MTKDILLSISARSKIITRWMRRYPLYALVVCMFVGLLVYIYVLGISADKPENYHDFFAAIDNLFVGWISAMSVFAVIQFFFIENQLYGAKRWLHLGPASVWVIPTYMPYNRENHSKSEQYYVTPPFDGQAAGMMVDILRGIGKHYPDRRIIGSHNVDIAESMLDDNILVIGLPNKNIYSRIFLGALHVSHNEKDLINIESLGALYEKYRSDSSCKQPYFGLSYTREDNKDGYICKININKKEFHSEMNELNGNRHEKNKLYKDYGLIIRTRNPFNYKNSLSIIGGIHGVGTLGGALHLLRHINLINEKYGNKPQALVIEVTYYFLSSSTNYVDSTIHKTKIVDQIYL